MALFRTKPRGDQLSFLTSCYRCAGELTITNGRPEKHDCREPWTTTFYAEHADVEDAQQVRSVILDRLAKALDNRNN